MCFACSGKGTIAVRKTRAAKVQQTISSTVKISDRCAGDPTKIDPSNAQFLNYIGLTPEQLDEYISLWNQGVREVARS